MPAEIPRSRQYRIEGLLKGPQLVPIIKYACRDALGGRSANYIPGSLRILLPKFDYVLLYARLEKH